MIKAALPALFLAAPAFAHEGFHVHPHGIDAGWLVLGASLVAAGLVALKVRSRK